MTYEHAEEWRKRIILTLAWQETQPVTKHTKDGEELSCLVQHLDGDGLFQITSTPARTKEVPDDDQSVWLVSTRTIDRLAAKGRLDKISVGPSPRFKESDIDRIVERGI